MKLGASVALLLVAFTASAAESRTYVLAIGNNTPPAGSALEPLRYADDDAGDFYSFAQSFADGGALLTVLDPDSQRRFPDLLGLAQPPTLVELKRQVARLGKLIAADVAAGREPTVLLFFSGHGTSGLDGGAPALALLDGPLTQAVLYDDVLAKLPARYVHLLVDACHAEAVVRPRDLDAAPVAVTASDMRTWAARETLARFPYVGAVLATTASAEAHEWDSYQRGVFTHEVLSGMRGGADVNGDGRVEYSELSAFLGAANGEVLDPRARVAVVLHPPALNGRAPLVDLTGAHGLARLVGQMASLGALFVEDERGNRLADVHAEPGFDVSVAVPAGQLLFVRSAHGEARVRTTPGATIALAGVAFSPPSSRPRGAVESSLRQGLFAAQFGPRYYRGHVDENAELVRVPLAPPGNDVVVALPPAVLAPAPAPTAPRPSRLTISLFSLGGAFSIASTVMGALTVDALSTLSGTNLERTATNAHDRALALGGASAATLVAAVVVSSIGALLDHRQRASRLTTAGGFGLHF